MDGRPAATNSGAGSDFDMVEATGWAGAGFFGGFVMTFVLGAVILATGLRGQVDDTSPTGSDVATLATGERIYATRCAACHGADGAGGIGSPLGDGVVVERYPDIAGQVAVIANGRRAMPGFAGILTEFEIEAVALYERERLGRAGASG